MKENQKQVKPDYSLRETIDKIKQENKKSDQRQNKTDKKISLIQESADKLVLKSDQTNKSIIKLTDALLGNDLQKKEDQKEMIKRLEAIDNRKERLRVIPADDVEEQTSWFKKALGLAGIATLGFFDKVSKLTKSITSFKFSDTLSKTVGSINGFLTKSLESIKSLRISKWIQGLIAGTNKTLAGLKKLLIPAKVFLKGFGSFFKSIGTFIRPLTGILRGVPFIGQAISIALGLIEGIKGFIEGFKEGGLKAGIREGLIGVVNGLVGWIFELIAKAGGWIAGFFGFEKLQEKLNAFDFSDTLSDFIHSISDTIIVVKTWFSDKWNNVAKPKIDSAISWLTQEYDYTVAGFIGVFDGFKSIFSTGLKFIQSLPEKAREGWQGAKDFISEKVDGLKDSIFGIRDSASRIIDSIKESVSSFPDKLIEKMNSAGDFIKSFNQKLLRMVLPKPGKPWYSVTGLISKAIPDSVYEYAGMNPKTGEVVQEIKQPKFEMDPIKITTGDKLISAGDGRPSRSVIVQTIDNSSRKSGGNTIISSTSFNGRSARKFDDYELVGAR